MMIRQLAIIFGCLALGELVIYLTHIPLPSSILGMLLLTLLLKLKVIRLEWVRSISDFLVGNIGFFFVPPGVAVMPETMSVERRKLIAAYGAKVILSDGSKGMKGAIDKANELAEKTPNSWVAGQFVNESNVKAHYLTTGPEIYEALQGKADILVAGVGNVGKYEKKTG